MASMDWRSYINGWFLGLVLILLLVLLPIGYIVSQLFLPASEGWTHIVDSLLFDYSMNTLWLLIGVALLSWLFAVPTAWLTTAFRFKGSKYMDWMLMLPLSMPTYIVATTYADMCSYTGTFQHFYHSLTGDDLPFDIMSMWGASLVMASVLYPYTYIMVRASFKQQSQTLIEASRLLGHGLMPSFFKIALPLARPAIAGSLFLIMMEVLNEYGTVKYYGISTFTTGIFKAWLSMGDASAAIRLAACLLLVVLLLMLLERWQRGNAEYATAPKSQKPFAKQPLTALKGSLALAYCLLPIALGFAIPLLQLLYWAWLTGAEALTPSFWKWVRNTVGIGLVTGVLALFSAVIMVYASRISKEVRLRYIAKLGTLGYAVPGAVIAVGIMAAFVQVDHLMNWIAKEMAGEGVGLLLSGTLTALMAAYLIRFLAIAYNPIEAGFEKTAHKLDEASRALGASNRRTLWQINLPLLKTSLLSAVLMVTVEVMKELPLTLILRPFNFDTLATKAFELASDEQIQASSSAALLIVLAGIIPVIALIRVLDKK